MAVVVGKAEMHGRSSNVIGNANIGAGQTMTEQMMLFEIEGQMVQLKSKSMFPIKDGDIVAAAGKRKKGIIKARAVTNVTRNMSTRSYFSVVGGKLIGSIIISVIACIFIVTIPVAILVMLVYFLDTAGATKAAASVKLAVNKYQRD